MDNKKTTIDNLMEAFAVNHKPIENIQHTERLQKLVDIRTQLNYLRLQVMQKHYMHLSISK